jgi:glycosyltransferase involved in cell wall biosynthesis
MPGCTFTVFTPTYNRAHTLPRAYEGLRAQTFTDFEWLVVDDGSTDDTRDLVAGWQRESSFPIRYLHQPNSGKHVAFNRGVREALGELFLCSDSDDALVPNALERFLFHWNAIPGQERHRFSAVTALCEDQHGNLIGSPFPRDVWDSDSLELYFKFKIVGDKVGFHRTDVLRQHPFPEPPGAKFVSEDVVWFAIAREYRTRFVNERLQRHDVQTGRERDNLTRLSRMAAAGRLVFHHAVLDDYLDYLSMSPLRFLRSAVNYSRYSLWCGVGPVAQFGRLHSLRSRGLLALGAPAGYAAFILDRGWRGR